MRPWHFLNRIFSANKVAVLMYHRVADVKADPWQLAVSPSNFESQIRLLTRKYKIVTPLELAKQIDQNQVHRNQVCLTFDDGYLDNFTIAKPLLEKHGCPATFFISTYFLQTQRPFWWDELQEIIFDTTKLPSPFIFSIDGETIKCELEDGGMLTAQQKEKQNEWVWMQEPPTQRCWLYFHIWEKIRNLPQFEIELLLQQLKDYVHITEVNMHDTIPMSVSNLKETSKSKIIKIGLHTHTHPVLSAIDASIQQQELMENKDILEKICGYPISAVSYPHGKFNDDTLRTVQAMNLKAAFTTTGKTVTRNSCPHRMGRFQVLNWTVEEFSAVLEKHFHA